MTVPSKLMVSMSTKHWRLSCKKSVTLLALVYSHIRSVLSHSPQLTRVQWHAFAVELKRLLDKINCSQPLKCKLNIFGFKDV